MRGGGPYMIDQAQVHPTECHVAFAITMSMTLRRARCYRTSGLKDSLYEIGQLEAGYWCHDGHRSDECTFKQRGIANIRLHRPTEGSLVHHFKFSVPMIFLLPYHGQHTVTAHVVTAQEHHQWSSLYQRLYETMTTMSLHNALL